MRIKISKNLVTNKYLARCMVAVLTLCFLFLSGPAQAQEKCQPLDKKRIKIEGYISKKFRKQRKAIIKEFTELGDSRAALRVYPMGEPSKVIAIG